MKKDKPSISELAQIAAQLRPSAGSESKAIKQAMALWTEAERELEQIEHRAEYMRGLVESIYTDSPEQWRARRENYPGDKADIDVKLLSRVQAAKVHSILYKDKSLSKTTRKTLFESLLIYARNHDMPPPPRFLREAREVQPDENAPYYYSHFPTHQIKEVICGSAWPKAREYAGMKLTEGEIALDQTRVEMETQHFKESLAKDELRLHTIRWAVEVRQRQLAESKSRNVPASLARTGQHTDSIQYKKKYRG